MVALMDAALLTAAAAGSIAGLALVDTQGPLTDQRQEVFAEWQLGRESSHQ